MIKYNSTKATLIGVSALVMWSSIATLSVIVKNIPPFQLLAIGMFLGGLAGALTWPFRKGAWKKALLLRWPIWLTGIYGIFIYHFCFFMAFRLAPPLQVNIINYLWPLFTIVFCAFLPGGKLRSYHISGLLIGMLGVFAALLAAPKGLSPDYLPGYLFASACALIWSSYTTLSRYFKEISTDSVSGFCFATSFLALLCHFAFEPTIWPTAKVEWIAMFTIGLLPTGIAFYAWDIGVKKGNLLFLSLVSYATRIASSLYLWLLGFTVMSWGATAGIVLVTIGAAVASKELFERKPRAAIMTPEP
jgi:drug/metabolite transporter (DMT)-like permease